MVISEVAVTVTVIDVALVIVQALTVTPGAEAVHVAPVVVGKPVPVRVKVPT